ncbi:MAG: hypothetical protein JST35_12585 [Armatimonadetes bacterium]|nr:hypothetical protein [Armatimonadota bacterium]
MLQFLAFGFEAFLVTARDGSDWGDTFNDFRAKALDAGAFGRIVQEKALWADTEIHP